jgi:hypothetical protein
MRSAATQPRVPRGIPATTLLLNVRQIIQRIEHTLGLNEQGPIGITPLTSFIRMSLTLYEEKQKDRLNILKSY